ncbi:MAG TPA: YciI family protein [Terricaulis sp.]|nr:YciI family protein [Terricaulis sp.]
MKYMALYTGSPQAFANSGWDKLDDKTRQERERAGMKAWSDWMDKHKAIIVVEGGPLGKTKRVDRGGISDISNAVAGYVVIEADSHEAAAALFKDHPHFTIFPGDAVEIMPCNPMPTM